MGLSKGRCKDTECIILVKYGVRGRTEAKTELDKMANFLSASLYPPNKGSARSLWIYPQKLSSMLFKTKIFLV